MEKFIGKKELARLRDPMLHAIKKGRFQDVVSDLLSDKERFNPADLDYTFSLSTDIDPVNQQRRRNFYLKKRELLLKLAPHKAKTCIVVGTESPLQIWKPGCYSVSWDLSRDFDAEGVPDEIDMAIAFAYFFK